MAARCKLQIGPVVAVLIIIALLPEVYASYLGYYYEQGIGGIAGNGNYELKSPSGIAASLDYIYVIDSLNNRIQVYYKNATYFTTIGGVFGTGYYEFSYPTDISAGNNSMNESLIYVADTSNHRLQIFKGTSYYSTIGSFGNESGKFNLPSGIAVNGDGTIFVADKGNNRVQIFYPNYTYMAKIGYNNGSGNYEFNTPVDVGIGKNNDILVVDSMNNRIQVFGSDYAYKKTIGGQKGSGDYNFDAPSGIFVDANGTIYVADSQNSRIQVFTENYSYMKTLFYGGTGDYRLSSPSNTFAESGKLYIADAGNNMIKIFRSSCSKDGECDDNNPSTKDTCLAAQKTCSNTRITSCISNDSYCPFGCTYPSDSDCAPVCGDNRCEKNENITCCRDCTCSAGYSCKSSGSCEKIPVCGDGIVSAGEVCCKDSGCQKGYTCVDTFECKKDGFCGDNVCNWNETEFNCCTDCNFCLPAYACTNNRCVPYDISKIAGYCEKNESCNDNNSCTIDSCNIYPRFCRYEAVSSCKNSDGCCLSGCSYLNDNDCKAPEIKPKLQVQSGPACGNKKCEALESSQTCCTDCGCPEEYACSKDLNSCTKTEELLMRESVEKQDEFRQKDSELVKNSYSQISHSFIIDKTAENGFTKFVYTYSNNKKDIFKIEGVADHTGKIQYIEGGYRDITIYFVYAFVIFILILVMLFLYIRKMLVKKEIQKTKEKINQQMEDHIAEFDNMLKGLYGNEQTFLRHRLKRWESEIALKDEKKRGKTNAEKKEDTGEKDVV